MGRARSRTINKKSIKTLKIGLIVGFISLIIIFLFAFIIPIKSDANSYTDVGYDDGDPNLCIGVNYDVLYSTNYPENKTFHILKGEMNEYYEAVASAQSFASNLPKGQLGCGTQPNYKLFL